MACTRILYGMEVAMRELLGRVAEDYGLDALELEQRYFGAPEKADEFPESIASSPPPKKVAKPKVEKAAAKEGALCQGKTTKGLPCKKKAVAGRCFCAMHGPKELKEPKVPTVPEVPEDPAEVSSPEPVKKAKKKASKKKAVPVVHSHSVDEAAHEGCEGCEVHGDVEERSSPEYAVRGSVRSRMMDMLSRVAAMEDEVVEEEE